MKSPAWPLVGQQLRLSPVKEKDLADVLRCYQSGGQGVLVSSSTQEVSAAVVELHHRVVRESDNAWFLGMWLRSIGDLVGVVEVRIGEPHDSAATISLIVIHREYHGKGLGTEAVLILERELFLRHHLTSIRAAVNASDSRALRFWGKLGFGDGEFTRGPSFPGEVLWLRKRRNPLIPPSPPRPRKAA